MPQKTRNRGFPTMSDLVKREEQMRKASNRAEARLANDLSQAGGLESAKRHNIAIRNWELEQVKQDLLNIKTAYKRSNVMRLQNPEALKYADPQLIEDMEDEEYLALQNEDLTNDAIIRGYGKDYFGYKSQPGSNKPHFQQIKAMRDKYRVKNYYEYTGPKLMDKTTRAKLEKQKAQNDSVQKRVKSFAAPEKPKVAGYQPEEKETNDLKPTKPQDNENTGSSDADKSHTTVVEKTIAETAYRPSFSPDQEYNLKLDSATPYSPKQGRSRRASKVPSGSPLGYNRSWEVGSSTGSKTGLPLYRISKPRTALDIVVDTNTYAPDGRLRTVHMLPDFDKSFAEASLARYIRTKHKREVDRQLTVNEMFGR